MEPRRLETIPGYDHPEDLKNYGKQKAYKTFSEGKKSKGTETFGKTIASKQYASYGEYDQDLCPICSSPPVETCNCGFSDKKCENDHIWYTDREGKVKNGNPHC